MEKANKESIECRYVKPQQYEYKMVDYSHAWDFVDQLDFNKKDKIIAIVNGSFLFGDFIVAFIYKYNLTIKKMTLCTWLYNRQNVNDLASLMKDGFIERLNIITSENFFFKENEDLIRYTYQHLDNKDDTFQLAVYLTHMKVYIFETSKGSKFVIQGSGNLPGKINNEQFTMEINPEIYNWYDEYFTEIIKKYKTIDYSIKFDKYLFAKKRKKNKNSQSESLFKSIDETGVVGDFIDDERKSTFIKIYNWRKEIENVETLTIGNDVVLLDRPVITSTLYV